LLLRLFRRRPRTGRITAAWFDAHVGLTTHALEQFVARARPVGDPRRRLRDLAGAEGRLVAQRPAWARSHNTADAFLQIGEWLLLVLVDDPRRSGSYTCVTVINGDGGPSWEAAYAKGWIATPPRRVRLGLWFTRRRREALAARRAASRGYRARR
jgi:hypothetical protein